MDSSGLWESEAEPGVSQSFIGRGLDLCVRALYPFVFAVVAYVAIACSMAAKLQAEARARARLRLLIKRVISFKIPKTVAKYYDRFYLQV